MIKLEDNRVLAHNQFVLLQPCTVKVPTIFKTPIEYNNYLLCGLKQSFHDNLFFYKIPINFKVYAKTPTIYNKMLLYFNMIDPSQSDIYEYVFIKNTEIVAFNMNSNVDVLLATAIETKQLTFIDAFDKSDMSRILDYLHSMQISGLITSEPQIMCLIKPQEYLRRNI